MPFFRMTASASGVVRKACSAAAADGTFEALTMPLE
jgi:tellurite resistance protein